VYSFVFPTLSRTLCSTQRSHSIHHEIAKNTLLRTLKFLYTNPQ